MGKFNFDLKKYKTINDSTIEDEIKHHGFM